MSTTVQEKVAILLQMFGDDVAADLLARMNPRTASEVREILERLKSAGSSARRREDAVAEFDRFMRYARGDGGRNLRIARETDDDDESAADASWQPFEPGEDPAEDLTRFTPRQLAVSLAPEHPRTAAIVLRRLPGDRSAEVLERLPEEHGRKVFVELSRDKTTPEVIENQIIASVVKNAMTVDPDLTDDPDPIQTAADVLRSIEKPQRGPLLEALETTDQETATLLLERLYVFADLLTLETRSLQRLLGEVDSQMLATALAGANPELVERVMSNLGKRARAALAEEIEFQQNVAPAVIEQARKTVAGILARLDQQEG